MSRTLPAVLGTLLLSLSLSTPAMAAFQVDGKPKVSFFAKGSPGALDIEGKSAELAISDDGTTLTCTVGLTHLYTGIELRDEHMRDKFLEVGTFPNATLSIARADLQLPTDLGQSTQGTVQGSFTAHGVTKPVTISYSLKKSKTGYAVDASFDYNASDFGIAIPSYLGITIDPAQKIRARFDMIDA